MTGVGRTRRWTFATFGVASAIGVVAAIAVIVLLEGPLRDWRRDRMRPAWLAAATGLDPEVRAEAWAEIEIEIADGSPLGDRILADLDAALERADAIPGDALCETARRLEAADRWSWDARPPAAVARSIELLASSPLDRIALERLLDRPDLRRLPVAEESVAEIWVKANRPERAKLLASLARLADPGRRRVLERLERPDDVAIEGRLRRLLAPRPATAIEAWSDPETRSGSDLGIAWELASDPSRPNAVRRLALVRLARASSLDEVPENVLAPIERGPVAGPSESVLPAVLLAEASSSSPSELSRRIDSWLASVDPARRAAGVLLAALAGDGRDALLRRVAGARRDEDDRRAATLAAMALALDPTATLPRDVANRREFLHRITPRDGRLDPELLALRLAAGDEFAVDALLERGVAASSPEIAHALELALLDRFCPDLARVDGTGPGGADRDATLVAWWNSRSDGKVAFDSRGRRWSHAASR